MPLHRVNDPLVRVALGFLMAVLTTAHAAQAQPSARFSNEPVVTSSEGHATLRWFADAPADVFRLEYDTSPGFDDARVWCEGPATQTFVSGLEQGPHHYRVRAGTEDGTWGAWSSSTVINVERQSLRLAWWLFGVGAVLFTCIVAFVVWQAAGDTSIEDGTTDE